MQNDDEQSLTLEFSHISLLTFKSQLYVEQGFV